MKIRLDSYLSLSTGLAPCSFLFLNKWLNQFSLADFLVAASVKLWVTLITHYQFWRQWDFITFVSCCLNGAICQKINLPLKLEKQLLGRWPYGRCQTDIFHIGFINGSWVPGRGNSLFGGKWCLCVCGGFILQQSRNANRHLFVCCLVAKLCPTLCDPMDYRPPGSSVRGISQARILKWVAISFIQGIFRTQGSNLSLMHHRQILYHWATWEAQ